MNLLQTVLILLTASGTSATTLWHKGLRGVGYGTCSGTQAEHPMVDIYVPDVEVEQEHERNAANPCWAWVCRSCSSVPLLNRNQGDCLLCQTGNGVRHDLR